MSRIVLCSVVVVCLLGLRAPAFARIAPPRIVEPGYEGQIVSPGDVRMSSLASRPGQAPDGVEWEIWTATPSERVWFATGTAGDEGLGMRLAGGAFEGDHGDLQRLRPETDYIVRTRQRTAAGWSDWAERRFTTAASTHRDEEPAATPTLGGGDPTDPWSVLDARFELEVVANGFRMPVNIAFVPEPGSAADDPFFYVAELYGTVKVVSRDGTVSDYATDLLNYEPNAQIPGTGENGLIGILVEPATGDVLIGTQYLPENPVQGFLYTRIYRLSSLDGGRTAASQSVLFDTYPEWQPGPHQIGRLSIGPDGKLYANMGDGGCAGCAWTLDWYRGKILRMNLDGSAPEDNPFYDAADGIDAADYVFAYGLRNPMGGDWRESDGAFYEVENGPYIDRMAKISAGDYLHWGDGFNGLPEQMYEGAIWNWQPAQSPTNIAFIQNASGCGSGFPEETIDLGYVAEFGIPYYAGPPLKGKKIEVFEFDAAGDVVGQPSVLMEYVGTGYATVSALAAGPDGLYLSDFFKDQGTAPDEVGASILRLRAIDPLIELEVDLDEVTWNALTIATSYDVIRGDLQILRQTGGDFAAATESCTGDDLAQTFVPEAGPPPSGGAYFYALRYNAAIGPACYESNGPGQYGLRDSEIAGSGNACP